MQHKPQLPERQIFQLDSDNWYVATSEGPQGPLSNREDAQRYVQLLETVDAARLEMAGLEI